MEYSDACMKRKRNKLLCKAKIFELFMNILNETFKNFTDTIMRL